MLKKINDDTYRFNAGNKTISVESLKNKTIEIYEDIAPHKTGFIFEDLKQFISFINNSADIAEALLEEENEDKWDFWVSTQRRQSLQW